VDGDEMDKLIDKISGQDFVSQAFWSPSTTD
jgi:putative Mg2+ transporter-C (MgtC) family protein